MKCSSFFAPISFGQLPVKSVNEGPNLVKSRDPLADPILRVQTLIYTLPQSLQWCMQYNVIADRVITTLGCTPLSVYLALISNQFLVIRNNGRRYLSSYPTNFLINNIFLIAVQLRVGSPWWRHQMETFSALLAICAGNSPVPGEFPGQRPVTWSFDVFFDLRLNKHLSKQSWGWRIETLSRPLWRHYNTPAHYTCIISDRTIENTSNHNLFLVWPVNI